MCIAHRALVEGPFGPDDLGAGLSVEAFTNAVQSVADAKSPEGFSLKRWSRRKLDATRESAPADDARIAPTPVAPAAAAPVSEAPLPPVESLTADADFTPYLQPQVDEAVKRSALKKMFTDPHFNVMDGLDVYIDDYTKTVPIAPDVLEQLMANLTFNPPIVPGEKPQAPATDSSIDVAPAPPDAAARLPDKAEETSGAPDPQDPVPPK